MSTEITNNFADRIRPYFTGDNLEKALKAGFNRETIRLWLNGSFCPSDKYIRKIAAFTGRDANWILTGEETSDNHPAPALTATPDEAGPSTWQYVRSLEKRIDDQSTLLKVYEDRMEAQRVRIDFLYEVLAKTGEQKDFLPLLQLARKG